MELKEAQGVIKKDSKFNINSGVKQGGILSPYLFNFLHQRYDKDMYRKKYRCSN
jgi:hypothetical protein